MKDRKSLFIIYIVKIILLSFTILFIINLYQINKDNIDNETEISVSLSDKKDIVYLPEIKEQYIKSEADNESIYTSFLDFPYDNMLFADAEAFEFIKKAYDNIDFSSEFKIGDLDVYTFYKEKYNRLLRNEIPFSDKRTGVESYINEYSPMKINNNSSIYDANDYIFYFFDMDEDSAPELCISNYTGFNYIFKYIPDLDKIILWNDDMSVSWYSLNGSRTIVWIHEGIRHVFYKLDKYSKEVYSVFFFSREHFNKNINQSEEVYMVALPHYTNQEKRIEIADDIKKQGFLVEYQKEYHFRVTKEQFDELTEDYFKAQELARKNIKEVTYTYEELFGEL